MDDYLVEFKISAAKETGEDRYARRKTIVDLSAIMSPADSAKLAKEVFSLISESQADA